MEEKLRNFDLASFKKASFGMAQVNRDAYQDMGSWSQRIKKQKVRNYNLAEIDEIINSGSPQAQQELSSNYFCKNGFYKKLVLYYATLLKYTGILIPNPSFGKSLSTPHIQKKYFNAVDLIDRLSLPTLLTNFAMRTIMNGSYYGIILSFNKNNPSFLDLPFDFCRSNYRSTEGDDVIEFNLAYFDRILVKAKRENLLSIYPEVFRNGYNNWKNSGSGQWFVVPSEISIYFSFFDKNPLFLSTIPAIVQYDETVELELKRDWEEIRKLVIQKVPHLNDGRLLFEPPEAEEMHNGAVQMLKGNENISVLTTYTDVDSIVSKTASDAVNNNLEKMAQNVYNNAGVSNQLFASTGSSTLEYSMKNDTALMMVLGNKFATFVTKFVNKVHGNSNINFKYNILPVTYYNEDKFIDQTYKLAGSGYSFLLPALASGLSQKDLGNIKDLENDVLNLKDKLIPLSSSYTESAKGDTGAPKKDEKDKSPKTLQNEEALDNQAKGGSN